MAEDSVVKSVKLSSICAICLHESTSHGTICCVWECIHAKESCCRANVRMFFRFQE
jgi:hypothetical protein